MTDEIRSRHEIFDELTERYPVLCSCSHEILKAYELIKESYLNDGVLYIAGNGGSAADSEHISGELMKSFMFKRRVPAAVGAELSALYGSEGEELAGLLEGGLGAVPLPALMSLSTATMNDVDSQAVFAQMVCSAVQPKDVFLGISTSGNSKNIIYAMMTAKAKGATVIGLTGAKECRMDSICDAVIHAPETETFKIQELHLPIYHALCAMLEASFFGGKGVQ
ncbi:MAG: SIS domain-containing protein [Ruminococcus sp.]|nr:SIS domain-containing protein [Ruminococcus sp.]